MLNFIKRYWPTALAVLILLTAVTGVYAKYVVQKTLDGTAKITAQLGSIQVLEHKAILDTDGSYALSGLESQDDNKTCTEHKKHVHVTKNEYTVVLPGLDIPKDPYVQITDKTAAIPVYVYLKIDTDTLPDTMKYTLEEHWQGIDLNNDSQPDVYVYSQKNSDDQWVPVELTANTTISVLKYNTIYVSQDLKTTPFTEVKLTFSACMGQVDAGRTDASVTDPMEIAAAAYTKLFPSSNS